MAEKRPRKDFGIREPAPLPLPPREPTKRSGHVALLMMGTIAVGSAAYTLMPSTNCDPPVSGVTTSVESSTTCSSGGSSRGGSGGSSARSSYFSSDSSGHSSSASSSSGSGSVTRGGFGSFAHAFFSGHG